MLIKQCNKNLINTFVTMQKKDKIFNKNSNIIKCMKRYPNEALLLDIIINLMIVLRITDNKHHSFSLTFNSIDEIFNSHVQQCINSVVCKRKIITNNDY